MTSPLESGLDKLPRTYSSATTTAPSSFATSLLESLALLSEKDVLVNNHEFLSGNMSHLCTANATEEEKRKYYQHCLRALDWSFSDRIIRDTDMGLFFAGAIEDMEAHIVGACDGGTRDAESMREQIPLDSVPFRYARRFLVKNIQDLSKDDEIRLACQALFLYLLRPRIPLKYTSLEAFLIKYPDLRDRNSTEQDRLRHTANWMDLAFHTIQPRNNKTFILNIIPRIVEGRNARYITGSGQTKPTADRVNIFRVEGRCEKIKRPPRRKKEEILAAAAAAAVTSGGKKPALTVDMMAQMARAEASTAAQIDFNKMGLDMHPYVQMGYPMNYMPANQWMQYPAMPWGTTSGSAYGKSAETQMATQAALMRRLSSAKDLEADPRTFAGFVPSYWAGGMNMYGRGGSLPYGLGAPTSSETSAAPSPTNSHSSASKNDSLTPESTSREFVSLTNSINGPLFLGSALPLPAREVEAVLGKRKLADHDFEYSKTPSRDGGLHLLFAAVSSIEASQS